VKLPWLNYLQQKRHQRVIDEAVQIFGGSGVVSGFAVEQLYREIRPLRIYEGASEVQKLIIASQTLKDN
jgi:acyl-CoA dehydrogenase